MTSTETVWLIVAALSILVALSAAHRVRTNRRIARDAHGLAEELMPEIRGLMSTSDPKGPTEGEPLVPSHYHARQPHLAPLLSREQLFAVETFYQCVESYRAARVAMQEAFGEEDAVSLGDRIRAKDRRDRCLKDLYYTGEGALQKLSEL